MSSPQTLSKVLFFFYTLFAFSSTFSIALAQTSLVLSLVLFIIIAIMTRYNPLTCLPKWFYLFVAGYIVWLYFTGLIGPRPLISASISREEWLFFAIPIGAYICNNETYRNRLLTIFSVGVLLISVYGIIQHFTGIHWFRSKPLIPARDFGYLVSGNFSHQLTFGNYYATASMFLLGLAFPQGSAIGNRRRIFFAVSALLAAVVTLLSYSRGSILGIIAGLFFLGILMGRKYILSIIGVLIGAIILITVISPGTWNRVAHNLKREYNLNDRMGRFYIWNKSLQMIREHPVFGVGQGNFYYEYIKMIPPDSEERMKHTHAHDDLLNIAAIMGIPGLVLFCGFWVVALGTFWRGWWQTKRGNPYRHYFAAAFLGSVAFFTTSLTEATFADEEVRQLLMFIWAIGLFAWYKTNVSNEVSVRN